MTTTPELLEAFAPNRLGRRPSPITMPGYRQGEPAYDRGRRRPVQVLTPEEVERIIAQTSRRGINGKRTRALIYVLWRGGLRISEAIGSSDEKIPPLLPSDVDLIGGWIRVRCGKNGESGIVRIDAAACRAIADWLDARSRVPGMPARAPLFCTYSQPAPGGRLGAPAVRDQLKLLARRAGITKRVHPHGFRHTMATDLAIRGVPMRSIQAQLRHRNLITTERYIARLLPGQGLADLYDAPTLDELDLELQA